MNNNNDCFLTKQSYRMITWSQTTELLAYEKRRNTHTDTHTQIHTYMSTSVTAERHLFKHQRQRA